MRNLFTGKRKRILSVIMTAALLFSSPGDIMVSHGEEAAGKTLPTHEAADTAIWTGSICLNKQEMTAKGETTSENLTEFCGKDNWGIWSGGDSKEGWIAANMMMRMDLSAYADPVVEVEGTYEPEDESNPSACLEYKFSDEDNAAMTSTDTFANGEFSQKISLKKSAESYFFMAPKNVETGAVFTISRVTVFDMANGEPVITEAPVTTEKPASYPTHSAVDRANWSGSIWVDNDLDNAGADTASQTLDEFCGKDNWFSWSGSGNGWAGANINMGMDLSAYADPVAKVTVEAEKDIKNALGVCMEKPFDYAQKVNVTKGRQEYVFALNVDKSSYFAITPKETGAKIVGIEIYDRALQTPTAEPVSSEPSGIVPTAPAIVRTSEPAASPTVDPESVVPTHAAVDTAVWTGTLMVDTENMTSSWITAAENLSRFCGRKNWGGWNGGNKDDGYVSANMYMNMDLSAYEEPVVEVEGTLQCEDSYSYLQYAYDEDWETGKYIKVVSGDIDEKISLKKGFKGYFGIAPNLQTGNSGVFHITRITIYDAAVSQPQITDPPVVTAAPVNYPTHSAVDVGVWNGRLIVDKTLMASIAETSEADSNLEQFCGSENLNIWSGSGTNWAGAKLEASMDMSAYSSPAARVTIRSEKTLEQGISWTIVKDFQNWRNKGVEEGINSYVFSLDPARPAYFGIQPIQNGVTVLKVEIGEREAFHPETSEQPDTPVSTTRAAVTATPVASIPASSGATAVPASTPMSTETPMPTNPSEITSSPEPGVEPGATVKPTKTPSSSAKPGAAVKPTKTPSSSAKPGAAVKPTKTPSSSAKPGAAVKPTKTPSSSVKPGVTAQPVQSPDTSLTPSELPSETPVVSIVPTGKPLEIPTAKPQETTVPQKTTVPPVVKTEPSEKPLEAGLVIETDNNIVEVEADGESVSIVDGDNTSSSVTVGKTVVNGKICKVVRIGKGAYKNNKKIKKLTVKNSVKYIGKNSFAGCKKLKKIVFTSEKVPAIGKDAFKNIDKKAVFYVPKKSLKKYKKVLKASGGFKKTMRIVGR